MANNDLNPKHAAYSIKAWLVINEKKVPIISGMIEYTLNQIPVAQVIVPSGLKMTPKGGVTEDIFTDEDLKGKLPAKIIVTGVGRPHPVESKATPVGDLKEQVIFDGYLGAKSVQFGVNGVSTSISLFHWLIDLDTASFASGNFTKNAPQDWFTREASRSVMSVLNPFWLAENTELAPGDLRTKDWWDDVLQPGMIYRFEQKLRGFKDSVNLNPNGVAALKRITAAGKLKLAPAAITGMDGAISTFISIKDTLADVVFSAAGGSSAFEKILTIAQTFNLALAPRLNECTLMAYSPTAPVDYTLPESEFDFGPNSSNPAVLPRGAIIHGIANERGIVNPDAGKVDARFLGQFVAPAQKYTDGPFLTMYCPVWLKSLTTHAVAGQTFKSGIGIVPDSNPTGGTGATNVPMPTNSRALCNAWVKAKYFDSLFSARTQEINCGFRLDIAPGDCISLTGKRPNVSGLAADGKWAKRGLVDSVTYLLNGGDAPKINTVYRLKHVFDKSDIELFGLTNGQEHPLFHNKEVKPLVL